MITHQRYDYRETRTLNNYERHSTLIAKLRFINDVAPNDRERIKKRILIKKSELRNI